ncbi:DUF551 domain-containing protein [Actinobacillus pleuropneumoniae]|uniref:DUF551 domain-containing protein n=1 Tax=Actinobacillus pleuropneumoniae TaxID=715 RepID=UPI001F238A03|nr:DUF551 domain-containing protein [Actinobacillus pleuropneumoniae]UKH17981.1 DUF551 domain-containing protein [Actinobacillus pleuropneumoniae]
MEKENNGWISVKDKKPELDCGTKSENLLLYGYKSGFEDYVEIFIGYMINGNRFYSDNGECGKVTHWQTLPKPPQD